MAEVGSSSSAAAPTTSCGACKFLRRKCVDGCVFAPYFSYDQGAIHFSAVHKVFGASNVSKLLLHLPVHRRSEAAATVSFEAQARMRDPVHGCVAYIFALQQQVARLQQEVESLITTHLSTFPINEVTDQQPCPRMVDGPLQSLPLCVQKDDGNVCHVPAPPDVDLGSTTSAGLNADNDNNLEGDMHPLLREAVSRLEHSLLGTADFHDEDVPFSLEELTSFSLMEDL